jgi:hypothetical protein
VMPWPRIEGELVTKSAPTGKSVFSVKPQISSCPPRANQWHFSARLTQTRGGSRSSRTRVGMRWTRQRRRETASQGGSPVSEQPARRRTAPKPGEACWRRRVAAYGEVVWFWHPLLMSSLRRCVGPTGLSQVLIRRRR